MGNCCCCNEVNIHIKDLNLPPTTPTIEIFEKTCDYIGVAVEKVETYFNTLREQWYYRSIDLLAVSDDMWKRMGMEVVLEEQILEYINDCRQNEAFMSFKEPIPTEKHIKYILNQLKRENESEATAEHIATLYKVLQEKYLLNTDKFAAYMDKNEWDEINIPTQLKVILSQKIHCTKFDPTPNQREGQYDNNDVVDVDDDDGKDNALYPELEAKADLLVTQSNPKIEMIHSGYAYTVDPFFTMNDVIDILSNELFVEKQKIIDDIAPVLGYKYKRIYHLSTISDTLYHRLLFNAPKCLKHELYSIMEHIRQNHKLMPFYSKKKKKTLLDIDWTWTTDQVLDILEYDMNLKKGELSYDVDILMNRFYSNLWDLFFVTDECWKSMPYYHKYEIVRIRMHDLLDQCKGKYNLGGWVHVERKEKIKSQLNKPCIKSEENLSLNPKLPEQWVNKYDGMELVEFILFNKDKHNQRFSFDGLCWSEYTTAKIKLINEYLNEHMVKKIQFLPVEHCKNNEVWSEYMTQRSIPAHIRFKLNFFAIRGQIQTQDLWVHDYIYKHYLKEPPQMDQKQMNDDQLNSTFSLRDYEAVITPPVFYITNIGIDSATIEFTEIEKALDCRIERMDTEQKEEEWEPMATITNHTSYVLRGLNAGTTYKVRTMYSLQEYSKPFAFKTNTICFQTSNILKETPHQITLMKLLESQKHVRCSGATLLYRASRDGKGGEKFRKKCHNKSNLLCLIECTSGNIFGGYTMEGWINRDKFRRTDEKAFVFLVKSANEYEPKTFGITQKEDALYCSKSEYCDFRSVLYISENGNGGWAGKNPQYYAPYPSNWYLTSGYSSFSIREVEAFQLK